MIKILANDGIDADGKTLLEEAGYQVDTEKVPQDELAKVLPQYDVVIVRSATQIRKDLIDLCPELKVIARAGVGLDNVDHEYAREKGKAVFNTPAASSQAVAELAFTHMFNLARFVHQSNYQMRAANSNFKQLKNDYSSGIQLRGKTLAIVGFGRIGQEVARIGLALGMRILPTDPMVDEGFIDITLYEPNNLSLRIKVETVDWEEALTQADFMTFHVPGIGKPLLGKEEFSRMKRNAVVINTARGGIIDEQALLDALNEGLIAGAGMDVFENEPKPMRALLEHPQVSVTPHIGASTVEAQANIGLELADKILAFFGDDK